MGRWIVRDPINEADSSALYLFVLNSLPGYVDYLGLATDNGGMTPSSLVTPACCCKICLYSACQKGTLNNKKPLRLKLVGGEAFGHSWVTLEKCDTPNDWFGEPEEIYSFGPKNGAGGAEIAAGKRFPSINDFGVSDYKPKKYDVTKKCWSRTAAQCEKDRKAFKNPGNNGVFDKDNYCTTEAIRFLKARGIA